METNTNKKCLYCDAVIPETSAYCNQTCCSADIDRIMAKARSAAFRPGPIIEHMAALGWKMSLDYGGGIHYGRPDGDYSVAVEKDGWSLGRFTDSDRDGVAVGRYETVADGETVLELMAALRELPRRQAAALAPRQVAGFAAIGNGLFARVRR